MEVDDNLTMKKARFMRDHQKNELVGYVFAAPGSSHRVCAYGVVRNSIKLDEWRELMNPDATRRYLRDENKRMKDKIDELIVAIEKLPREAVDIVKELKSIKEAK